MSSQKKRGGKTLATITLVIAGAFALFGFTSCMGAVEDVPQPTATVEMEPNSKPSSEAKAGPTISAEEIAARGSAESYLYNLGGFSYNGLIDQLSSEYGEQFPEDVAKRAVDSLDVDWDEQAVMSAKSYIEMDHFSRQGLIDQLSSEYGEGFTIEQATHAANEVGL